MNCTHLDQFKYISEVDGKQHCVCCERDKAQRKIKAYESTMVSDIALEILYKKYEEYANKEPHLDDALKDIIQMRMERNALRAEIEHLKSKLEK